jgi:hypothetical protein
MLQLFLKGILIHFYNGKCNDGTMEEEIQIFLGHYAENF